MLLLATLIAWPAAAERPTGDYSIALPDQEIVLATALAAPACLDAPTIKFCFDAISKVQISPGPPPIELEISNPSGGVFSNAAGHLEGDLVAETFPGSFLGTLRGKVGKPVVRMNLQLQAPADFGSLKVLVQAQGRYTCKPGDTSGRLSCVGPMEVCAFEGGRRIGCAKERGFSFELLLESAPLEVKLVGLTTNADDEVEGGGEVVLPTGEKATYDVTGRYDAARDTTDLHLAGKFRAAGSTIDLKKAVLAGGAATSGKISFLVAGQKGKAVLGGGSP